MMSVNESVSPKGETHRSEAESVRKNTDRLHDVRRGGDDLPKRIFVYGTLMNGFGNHRLLEGATFVGNATTEPRFTMISLGGFPGVLDGGDTPIKGEVYQVDSHVMLAHLDRLEGHPNWYRRTPITVRLDNGGEADVEIYLYLHKEETAPVVESGDWKAFRGRTLSLVH